MFCKQFCISFSLGNVVKLTEKTTELLGRCKYNFEKKRLTCFHRKICSTDTELRQNLWPQYIMSLRFLSWIFKTPHLLTAEPVQTKRHCCLSFDVFYAYRFSQAPKKGWIINEFKNSYVCEKKIKINVNTIIIAVMSTDRVMY